MEPAAMAMAVAARAAEMVAAMRAAVGMETAVRAAEAKVAASRPERGRCHQEDEA